MVLDIIIIVLVIGAVILGNKKGFIKIASGLVTFLIAFVIAYIFANNVADYIRYDTGVGNKIEQSISTSISSALDKENKEDKKEETSKLSEMFGDKINEIVESNKDNTSVVITNYAFTGIGFVATFVVVKLVLIVATIMLDGVFNLPVLKSFNKLGGIIASVILLLLKIWIVLAIIHFVSPMEFMQGIVKAIDSSVITSMLYDHNILVTLISTKFKI